MNSRNFLFLAIAFAMVLVAVADGDYGSGYGNHGGNYGNYKKAKYTPLYVNPYYNKGVVVGKVPALWNKPGVYWEKCEGEHYFQLKEYYASSNTFWLRFTAYSGNSKGYKGYNSGTTQADDSVQVEYKLEGSKKWVKVAILKPDDYRTPKTSSFKVELKGWGSKKVTFRFRSLQDCEYENNDYGVWSFADFKAVTYENNYGGGHDDDDHGYGNDNDDHYGGGYDDDDRYGHDNDDNYGNDYDDDHDYGNDYDDDHDYGNDYDDDDHGYGNDNDDHYGGGYGGGKKD